MENRNQRRTLIVSREYPISGQHGSGAYTLDLVHYLRASGFQIQFLYLGQLDLDYDRLHWFDPRAAESMQVKVQGYLVLGGLGFARPRSVIGWGSVVLRPLYNRLPRVLRRIFQWARQVSGLRRRSGEGMPEPHRQALAPKYDSLPSPTETAAFGQAYQGLSPDIVIADYVWLAPLLDTIPASDSVVKVVLTKDVLHRRVEAFARAGIDSGHAAWTSADEGTLLRKADLLVAIQPDEAAIIHGLAPEADVVTAPMAARPTVCADNQVDGRCLFVGSRGQHNIHGLNWFLDQVWPQVLRDCPDASLHVCGSVCEGASLGVQNVEYMGVVPDLGREYCQAEVCLAPLLLGSGLKIKLIEALAYGRASVATDSSLQGIEMLAGQAALVANTPMEFAAATTTVLMDQDTRMRLESQARQFATGQFSPAQCYGPLVARLRAHIAQLATTSRRY